VIVGPTDSVAHCLPNQGQRHRAGARG
jgi:hypothetical protein